MIDPSVFAAFAKVASSKEVGKRISEFAKKPITQLGIGALAMKGTERVVGNMQRGERMRKDERMAGKMRKLQQRGY